MLIDTNIDNHILQIEKELENYSMIEFKNMISSIFINEIMPSKEELKTLSLVFRICVDSIKDNKNDIQKINTAEIIKFINSTVNNANVLSFKIIYNGASDCISFKIITNLNNSLDTYCLKEKLCIDGIKYYAIDELIDKMLIISMDVEE